MRPARWMLVVATLAATSSVQAADKKRECARTSEAGQKDRDDGHLKSAHKRFLACAQDECPEVVRTDCHKWIQELDAILPSVVFVVHDPKGNDAPHARVKVDGEPIEATGKAMVLDPGEHVVRAELDGASVTKQIQVAEAVKNRVVTLDLEMPKPTESPKPKESKDPEPASRPVLGYVLGGLGVVLAGVTAALWVDGKSRESDFRNTCSPRCAPDDVDALRTEYRISYVTGGAAVLALGAGAYFLFLAPSSNARSATSSPLVWRF